MVSIKNIIMEMLRMFQVFNTSFTNTDFFIIQGTCGHKTGAT